MIPQQNFARRVALMSTSATNGATTTANIDTLGFDHVTISVLMTTSDNATNNPSVLKISESDTTDATNFSDVTGLVGDSSFTIPASETAATSITKPYAVFNVNTQRRKRYLKVTISPTTTQSSTVLAELSRAEQTPATTDQANVVVTL